MDGTGKKIIHTSTQTHINARRGAMRGGVAKRLRKQADALLSLKGMRALGQRRIYQNPQKLYKRPQ